MTHYLYSLLFTAILAGSYCGAVQATCSLTLECLNGGIFDTDSCKCECLPIYSGVNCEKANCADESLQCGTIFKVETCSSDATKFYCPDLCDQPVCTCGSGGCINGGVFDPKTCSCRLFLSTTLMNFIHFLIALLLIIF